MNAHVMNDEVLAIETLIETSAAIVAKLNALVKIDAPVLAQGMGSDCCSSNNYEEQ
jgi:hypothetical protein